MIYRAVNWRDFNQAITPNFSVGEVSSWDSRRLVSDPRIADNAIRLARELQKARDFIARPIKVNSWYRPPDINRAIGGASNSQHLTANAADITCPSLDFWKFAGIFRSNWNGYLLVYPLSKFIHVDLRAGTGWVPNSRPAYYDQME